MRVVQRTYRRVVKRSRKTFAKNLGKKGKIDDADAESLGSWQMSCPIT